MLGLHIGWYSLLAVSIMQRVDGHLPAKLVSGFVLHPTAVNAPRAKSLRERLLV